MLPPGYTKEENQYYPWLFALCDLDHDGKIGTDEELRWLCANSGLQDDVVTQAGSLASPSPDFSILTDMAPCEPKCRFSGHYGVYDYNEADCGVQCCECWECPPSCGRFGTVRLRFLQQQSASLRGH